MVEVASKTADWADKKLSQELPTLVMRGEGLEVEFKVDFPAQGHDLAKSIAAFATSGGGKILMGVANDGCVVGLTALDAVTRDKVALRAQQLSTAVRPSVKVVTLFAAVADKAILCIHVPKQDEPIYYYDGRPCLRDDRCSRPAEPDEVKQLIWSHPSSEFKRREEEFNAQQNTGIVKEADRHCAEMAEMMRVATEDSSRLTDRLNRQIRG